MQIEIFDVEHGACALVTAENGVRMMIDCGHNGATGWRPGDHLRSLGIDSIEHLLVTNYDEDHVSGLPNFYEHADAQWLWRSKNVSGSEIRALKTEDGFGPGIEKLIEVIDRKYTGTATEYPKLQNVDVKTFWNPKGSFDDENNLSNVAVLTYMGAVSIIFPGDLENAGWLKLLEQQSFRDALANVRFFVASHHGRDSGICDEVFNFMTAKPNFVLISDKTKGYQTQETTDYYRSKASGGIFRGNTRHVLTTRRDQKITIKMTPTGWAIS